MANSCGNPAVGDDKAVPCHVSVTHTFVKLRGWKETRFCNVGVHCNGDKDCLYTGWSSWNDCSATCRLEHMCAIGTTRIHSCYPMLSHVRFF